MAAHNILCKFREVPSKILAFEPLLGGGRYTGHHLITDHCFYIAQGLRGAKDDMLIVENYDELDAPCIVVTADSNGGKSREHGDVHKHPLHGFDNKEKQFAADREWTYGQAKAAAMASVQFLGVSSAEVANHLDQYFCTTLRMTTKTKIRAGEHTSFPGYNPRRNPQRSKTHRYQPYGR